MEQIKNARLPNPAKERIEIAPPPSPNRYEKPLELGNGNNLTELF